MPRWHCRLPGPGSRSGWFWLPGFVVYRREAIVGVGGFAEDLYSWADTFANCVLGFRYGACYIPEVLAVIRVLPSSYSVMCSQDVSVRRAMTYRVVDLLQSSRFRDVAPSFRDCALLPYCRIEVLGWLFATTKGRRYLTARLALRVAVRSVWKGVKPYVPSRLIPKARRLVTRWAQFGTAVGAGQ